MKKSVCLLLAFVLMMTLAPFAAAAEGDEDTALVTDAYFDSIDTAWGTTYEYHIPQINLDSDYVQQVNAAVYDKYYAIIQNCLREVAQDGYVYSSGGMDYGWSVHDDILSLVVENFWGPEGSGGDEFEVYNISVSTGEPVSEAEVLAYCGFTEEEFRTTARQVLEDVMSPFIMYSYEPNLEEFLDATLSDENIDEAQIYIGQNGDLCMACGAYIPAGGGHYYYLFDLSTGTDVRFEHWEPEEPEPVDDGFAYQYTSPGGTYEYHIPEVQLDGEGAAALNDGMWNEIYQQYLEDTGSLEAAKRGDYPETREIWYDWAVNGNILSIYAGVELNVSDLRYYYVYNIDLTTGEQLSRDAMLARCGFPREQLDQSVKEALRETYRDSFFVLTEDDIAMMASAERMEEAKVFLNRRGELCAYVPLANYVLPGGDVYPFLANLSSPGQFSFSQHTEGGDDRLIYFIEHSDTEYFTRADVDGFGPEDCTHAINGVYARSGRKFMDQDLQNYYLQFDWYVPAVEPADFTDAMLNDCQQSNIAMMLEYKAEQGF